MRKMRRFEDLKTYEAFKDPLGHDYREVPIMVVVDDHTTAELVTECKNMATALRRFDKAFRGQDEELDARIDELTNGEIGYHDGYVIVKLLDDIWYIRIRIEEEAEETSTDVWTDIELEDGAVTDEAETSYPNYEAEKEALETAIDACDWSLFMAPVVVEEETGLVAEEEAEGAEESHETIQMTKVVLETIKATAKAMAQVAGVTARMAGAMVRTARDVIPVLLMILSTLADWSVTAYYWLTTWVPIGARKVAFAVTWDIIPATRRMVREARRMAIMAYRMMVRAMGGIRTAVMAFGGLALTGILMVVAVALRTAQTASEGWQMRREIIEEGKAA